MPNECIHAAMQRGVVLDQIFLPAFAWWEDDGPPSDRSLGTGNHEGRRGCRWARRHPGRQVASAALSLVQPHLDHFRRVGRSWVSPRQAGQEFGSQTFQ